MSEQETETAEEEAAPVANAVEAESAPVADGDEKAQDVVLTDAEKSALLEGVQNGAVEVLTGSSHSFATLREFRINPRSRIKRNSFPRLQVLNEQLADRLKKHAETSLQCEVSITSGSIVVRPYSEVCAAVVGLSAITVFKAPPLEGLGGIVVDAESVNQLVEAFFGGSGDDAPTKTGDAFSPGELSICRIFSNAILSMLQDVWESFVELAPETAGLEVGMDLVDIAADTDRVVSIDFDMSFATAKGRFQLLFPVNMLKPLLPIFEGQKGDRDAAEDARWERCLRAHLPDATVRLTGCVGKVRLPLKHLQGLEPGDIVTIDDPSIATVVAGDVPVVHGRFGVHAGKNAVEAERWATQQTS